MSDNQIIINGTNLNDIKELLYTGQRVAITTSTFEKIIELLEEKTQECAELKKYKHVVDKLAGKQVFMTNKDKMPELYNNAKDLKLDCYHNAMEKIEKYTRKQFCDNCEDIGSTEYNCHCEYCEYKEYFDIINKTKMEEQWIKE